MYFVHNHTSLPIRPEQPCYATIRQGIYMSYHVHTVYIHVFTLSHLYCLVCTLSVPCHTMYIQCKYTFRPRCTMLCDRNLHFGTYRVHTGYSPQSHLPEQAICNIVCAICIYMIIHMCVVYTRSYLIYTFIYYVHTWYLQIQTMSYMVSTAQNTYVQVFHEIKKTVYLQKSNQWPCAY